MFLIAEELIFNSNLNIKKHKFKLINKYCENISNSMELAQILKLYSDNVIKEAQYEKTPIYEDGYSFIDEEPLIVNYVLSNPLISHLEDLNIFLLKKQKKGLYIYFR